MHVGAHTHICMHTHTHTHTHSHHKNTLNKSILTKGSEILSVKKQASFFWTTPDLNVIEVDAICAGFHLILHGRPLIRGLHPLPTCRWLCNAVGCLVQLFKLATIYQWLKRNRTQREREWGRERGGERELINSILMSWDRQSVEEKERQTENKFYFNVLSEKDGPSDRKRGDRQWEKSKHAHEPTTKKTQTHINIEVGSPGIGGVNRWNPGVTHCKPFKLAHDFTRLDSLNKNVYILICDTSIIITKLVQNITSLAWDQTDMSTQVS